MYLEECTPVRLNAKNTNASSTTEKWDMTRSKINLFPPLLRVTAELKVHKFGLRARKGVNKLGTNGKYI